jgi:hypothetical protein
MLGFWMHKGENIKVDFNDISDKEKGWVIIVTNTKKQPGTYHDQIILKTDHSEIPEIILRIYGDITNRQIINNRPPDDDDGPPIAKSKKEQ